MFAGIKNLLGSEKAIAAGLLVIGATLLTALGKMSVAQWQEYSLWCLGIYTGGKTVQGGIAAIKSDSAATVAAAAVEAATELSTKITTNDSTADTALAAKFAEKAKE